MGYFEAWLMLFKGVIIGLELREFDRMCAMRLVFLHWQKSRFGKNRSYEVLTPDRRYAQKSHLRTIICEWSWAFLLQVASNKCCWCLNYVILVWKTYHEGNFVNCADQDQLISDEASWSSSTLLHPHDKSILMTKIHHLLSVKLFHFLAHQLKHMLWAIKRIISLRWFFWVPTIYVLIICFWVRKRSVSLRQFSLRQFFWVHTTYVLCAKKNCLI